MSKLKIEIKGISGDVLFSHEAEGNTVKKTVEQANLSGADLHDANLYGATIYFSDTDFDAENRLNGFMRKTQLESVETEMLHDVGVSPGRSFTWKNVLKIKSWRLKETEPQNAPDVSTGPGCDQDEDQCDLTAETDATDAKPTGVLERIALALERIADSQKGLR